MSRRFTLITVLLTTVVGFLVGAIVAGGLPQAGVTADARRTSPPTAQAAARAERSPVITNFADVVERVNPAVVNIEATSPAGAPSTRRRRRARPGLPDLF